MRLVLRWWVVIEDDKWWVDEACFLIISRRFICLVWVSAGSNYHSCKHFIYGSKITSAQLCTIGTVLASPTEEDRRTWMSCLVCRETTSKWMSHSDVPFNRPTKVRSIGMHGNYRARSLLNHSSIWCLPLSVSEKVAHWLTRGMKPCE